MTDWTPSAPLDQPYAMTRFGAHRFVEHLAVNHLDGVADGTPLGSVQGNGAQSFAVKNGKCYVAGGWGPNLKNGWRQAFGTDPSFQGIFELDGAKVTKIEDFPPGCPGAFGVCLDQGGNLAYDRDGWAQYGNDTVTDLNGAGIIGVYNGSHNAWAFQGNCSPRLIGDHIVFAINYLGVNGNPGSTGQAWLVQDTEEAVFARAGTWPPVLERRDAMLELPQEEWTQFHCLGDIRQDPQGQIWGVVLRVQSGSAQLANTDHLDPANYVAVVKVPAGLEGECEVWWEAAGTDVPWPYRGTLELEMADPDYMVACLARPGYTSPKESGDVIHNWWQNTDREGTWTNYHGMFWRLDKHDKNAHRIEYQGFTSSITGGTLRFQDVVIADAYYNTIWVRYPDGTWHEERADAGDETYFRTGDPIRPNPYLDVDDQGPLVPDYFDFIGVGPTNGTDLYALVEYTQSKYEGYYPTSGRGYSMSGGDWVRWTPNPSAVPTPAVLTAAIGPARYFI